MKLLSIIPIVIIHKSCQVQCSVALELLLYQVICMINNNATRILPSVTNGNIAHIAHIESPNGTAADGGNMTK